MTSYHGGPASAEQGVAILVLRSALGAIFVVHGLIKVFVYSLPGTVAFFESVGLPGAAAYAVTVVELVAGVLLLIGYQTRWAALAVIPVMLGATWTHLPNGFTFNNQGGGWEFTAFLAAAALALFLSGQDGAFSLAPKGRKAAAHS